MRRDNLSGNDAVTARRPQLLFSLFNAQRVGWYITGALVVVGVAAYGTASAKLDADTQAEPSSPVSQTVEKAAPATTAQPQPSTPQQTNTSFSVSSNGHTPPVTHLNVNGQDVPVPSNGSSTQTVTNDSGNTTVDISNTTTQSSDSQGTSSSTFSLNVVSNSTAEGGAAK